VWLCFDVKFLSDFYSSVVGQSPLIDGLLVKLQQQVSQELRVQKQLFELLGSIDMLLATSITST
jgi:U3 small nucleolar RNA-associated protein 15